MSKVYRNSFYTVLLQTDAEKNLKTVLRLPVDSDILTVILDYAYTDCVPQLSATGINFAMPSFSDCKY